MENKETIGGFEVFSSPQEMAAAQSSAPETVNEEAPQQESQPVQEVAEAAPEQVVETSGDQTPQEEVPAPLEQPTQQESFEQVDTPETTQYTDSDIEGAVFSYLSEKLGTTIASLEDLTPKSQPLDERVEAIAKFVQETGREPREWFTYQSLNTSEMDDVTALKVETALQYPDLTADEVNTLVSSKYKVDPDLYTEAEINVARLQMKVDASSAKKKIEEQRMRYAAPEPVDASNADSIESFITDDWISDMRTQTSDMEGIEFDLGNDKTFSFGLDDRYKQELMNKNARLDEYFDPYVREDGSWDFETLNAHRAIVDNIDAIVSSTYRQGLSDGQKNVVSNAANIQSQTPNRVADQENPLVSQMKTILDRTSNKKTTFMNFK